MFTLLLTLALPAQADALDDLLAKGPLVLVESKSDGHLNQVTGLTRIDAPIGTVWKTLVDFESYDQWMPAIAKVDVVEGSTATELTVDWGIQVPGPNVQFTGKYVVDESAHTIKGTWVKGALEGSHWDWKLVDEGNGKTMVYRTTFSNVVMDNWLVRQFDDEWHSLEYGLNAATPVLEAKALKERVEGK